MRLLLLQRSEDAAMADQSATSRLRLLLLVGPVVLSVLLYQRDEFDPAPLPVSASWLIREVPARNDHLLTGSEKVGDGLLPGPEDLAYCAETGFLYTGCSDGWIKRVAINGSLGQAENWAFVGGRPFGLAFGPGGELVVANSEKGLMRLTGEGTAEVLVAEAEGVPFRLTDGVDVPANGIIYFTDASYKYDLEAHIFDILEGRPYGRLMSFEPLINRTRVLVRDLYFANGVAISPGQDFLVFCESPLRRCSRYYIEGEKKGTIDNFVDDLPGFPDNIRYDGDGHYWIGLPSEWSKFSYLLSKYPFLRKIFAILLRYVKLPEIHSKSGILSVDLAGNPLTLYTDPSLSAITCGLKIGTHLYYGSFAGEQIGRLDLTMYAARLSGT